MPNWGEPPWVIDFHPPQRDLPTTVDFAIIGGGFSGLATAAWLRHAAPEKSVALFEAETIGAGSSGRSGGMALAESSVGDLPGLGDVLDGFTKTLRTLEVDGDAIFPGAWEIGRKKKPLPNSPIRWADSGTLHAVAEVPGGHADPGKLVSGLARAADRLGAQIHEHARVEDFAFEQSLRLTVRRRPILAGHALFATNAQSLELNGLEGSAHIMFTLAVATVPLTDAQLKALGLSDGKSFYTVDFPYLWGRSLPNNGLVFGSGLMHVENWRELTSIDISSGEAAQMIANLQRRVRGLVPEMHHVRFTHAWGGPMAATDQWAPVFERHPHGDGRVLVLGAYAGQGVTLSTYLGRWAAEAMLGRRTLPNWRHR